MYELVAVVLHLGEQAGAGHFVTYIFQTDGSVIEVNDTTDRKHYDFTVESIIEKNSYLFF